eukprot:gene9364-biopygen18211
MCERPRAAAAASKAPAPAARPLPPWPHSCGEATAPRVPGAKKMKKMILDNGQMHPVQRFNECRGVRFIAGPGWWFPGNVPPFALQTPGSRANTFAPQYFARQARVRAASSIPSLCSRMAGAQWRVQAGPLRLPPPPIPPRPAGNWRGLICIGVRSSVPIAPVPRAQATSIACCSESEALPACLERVQAATDGWLPKGGIPEADPEKTVALFFFRGDSAGPKVPTIILLGPTLLSQTAKYFHRSGPCFSGWLLYLVTGRDRPAAVGAVAQRGLRCV